MKKKIFNLCKAITYCFFWQRYTKNVDLPSFPTPNGAMESYEKLGGAWNKANENKDLNKVSMV